MAKRRCIAVLSASDYPTLQKAASAESRKGQHLYLLLTAIRLALLLLSAVAGIVAWRFGHSNVRVGAIVASCALVAAATTEAFLLANRPDKRWYAGRALSESAKTLTWRYAAGAGPFQIKRPENECDQDFQTRLLGLVRDMAAAGLVAPALESEQITQAMRRLRAVGLSERRNLYRSGRIDAQRSWYTSKSLLNSRAAQRWSVLLLLLEVVGAVAGVMRAADLFDIDLIGITAAMVAAGIAWLQTRQHGNLAAAYALASQELAAIATLYDQADTEEAWSEFVDHAETAISREHTMWRARRSS